MLLNKNNFIIRSRLAKLTENVQSIRSERDRRAEINRIRSNAYQHNTANSSGRETIYITD